MQKLDPTPRSPCFDEMPNIPGNTMSRRIPEGLFLRSCNYLEANSANVCINRENKTTMRHKTRRRYMYLQYK